MRIRIAYDVHLDEAELERLARRAEEAGHTVYAADRGPRRVILARKILRDQGISAIIRINNLEPEEET